MRFSKSAGILAAAALIAAASMPSYGSLVSPRSGRPGRPPRDHAAELLRAQCAIARASRRRRRNLWVAWRNAHGLVAHG